MFNRSRFNLQRYNLPSDGVESETYIQETMVAQFDAIVTNGGEAFVVLGANAAFGASAYGVSGVSAGLTSAGETVNSKVSGYVVFSADSVMEEQVRSAVWMSQDSSIVETLGAVLETLAAVKADLYDAVSAREDVLQHVEGAKDYTMDPVVITTVVDAQVTTFEFDIGYATLTLTLAPGDTLVIDSDNFVVLLNGENAIHTHSGVWPELSRETYDVQVTSGTIADLETEILFTERYL